MLKGGSGQVLVGLLDFKSRLQFTANLSQIQYFLLFHERIDTSELSTSST